MATQLPQQQQHRSSLRCHLDHSERLFRRTATTRPCAAHPHTSHSAQRLITCRAAAGAADAFEDGAAAGPGAASDAAARPQGSGASFPATVFNLVNVIMGAGYVSIPFALRQGGWAAAGVLWLLGAVFCFTGNTILQCCERIDQQRQQQQQQCQPGAAEKQPGANSQAALLPPATPAGYEDVAGAAFGGLGKLLVSAVMYTELLGICCVYIVLEAEALSTLLGSTGLGSVLSNTFGASCWILGSSALIVPTVLLPSVEALATLGAVGVMAAVTVGCVVAAMFSSTPAPLTALSDTTLIRLATLPSVLGVLAFVYAGHSTFPVIQQSMRNPAAGRAAVTLGYIATAAICTLLGAFGYALWGPGTAEVVTANLPTGSALALVLTALTAANPFSAFAVTLEPVALMLQRQLGRAQANSSSSSSSSQLPYAVRAAIRLGLACACCVTAAALPYVAEMMGIVGALLTMSVSLILPALMHLQLFKHDMPACLMLCDCVVVLLGVACAYVGATSALGSLQQKLAAV